MGACDTQTFSGITQARFDCLVQQAATAGIAITGDAGEATRDGITIRWQFAPAGQTLELQCTDSPLFVPCGTINARIHALVDACP
jgi:hypothetical protein